MPVRRIVICCPPAKGLRSGNRITAQRWARILRDAGHGVRLMDAEAGAAIGPADVLIALHARHSAGVIRASRRAAPQRPIVLAMTGTDLYRDIRTHAAARGSLDLADAIVVMHDRGADALPRAVRPRVHVIYQSAAPTPRPPAPPQHRFRVLVIGHLRYEKDPLRAALAARGLPADSRIAVEHYGGIHHPRWAVAARRETQRNARYRWFGDCPRGQVRRRLAASHLMVLSSRMEGGASVLSEALADSVPIVASRIPICEALLGADYPGLYPTGSTPALRALLLRAESDGRFLRDLRRIGRRRAPLITPQREATAWRRLLQALP